MQIGDLTTSGTYRTQTEVDGTYYQVGNINMKHLRQLLHYRNPQTR